MAASEVATPLLPMATFLRVLGLFGGFPLVPSNQVHPSTSKTHALYSLYCSDEIEPRVEQRPIV